MHCERNRMRFLHTRDKKDPRTKTSMHFLVHFIMHQLHYMHIMHRWMHHFMHIVHFLHLLHIKLHHIVHGMHFLHVWLH